MKKNNKFTKFIDIFNLHLDATSYKSASLRIVFSLLTMFAVCLFRINITVENVPLNFLLYALLLAIIIPSVLIFFAAVAECLQVGENLRHKKNKK